MKWDIVMNIWACILQAGCNLVVKTSVVIEQWIHCRKIASQCTHIEMVLLEQSGPQVTLCSDVSQFRGLLLRCFCTVMFLRVQTTVISLIDYSH